MQKNKKAESKPGGKPRPTVVEVGLGLKAEGKKRQKAKASTRIPKTVAGKARLLRSLEERLNSIEEEREQINRDKAALKKLLVAQRERSIAPGKRTMAKNKRSLSNQGVSQNVCEACDCLNSAFLFHLQGATASFDSPCLSWRDVRRQKESTSWTTRTF